MTPSAATAALATQSNVEGTTSRFCPAGIHMGQCLPAQDFIYNTGAPNISSSSTLAAAGGLVSKLSQKFADPDAPEVWTPPKLPLPTTVHSKASFSPGVPITVQSALPDDKTPFPARTPYPKPKPNEEKEITPTPKSPEPNPDVTLPTTSKKPADVASTITRPKSPTKTNEHVDSDSATVKPKIEETGKEKLATKVVEDVGPKPNEVRFWGPGSRLTRLSSIKEREGDASVPAFGRSRAR